MKGLLILIVLVLSGCGDGESKKSVTSEVSIGEIVLHSLDALL